MKRRITSFFLAICFIAALVPVLSTGVAIGSTYTQFDYSQKAVACRVKQRGSGTGDCGIASMASIEAYVNGLTGNSQAAYDAVFVKNNRSKYCNWSLCGYVAYKPSSFGGDMQKFYLSIYQQLAKGLPCIVYRSSPAHYSLVVAYRGTSSTFSTKDFLIMDVIINYSDTKCLMTMEEWLAKGSSTAPSQLVVRKTGVGAIQSSGSHYQENEPAASPSPTVSATPQPTPSPSAQPSASPAPETYTLTFDANGGAVSGKTKTVTLGKPVGTLPVPTRDGYRFKGWCNKADGSYFTADTTYNLKQNTTLTAVWEAEKPAHEHQYEMTSADAHPHVVYWICKECGDVMYTRETTRHSDCLTCQNTPSEWAKEEVEQAIVAELIPTTFQSKYATEITRGEFCNLIVNMLEQVQGKSIDEILAQRNLSINYSAFSDTKDKNILAAHALGIVNGCSAGKFNPNGMITRQEAATILVRICYSTDFSKLKATNPGYVDDNEIASWAKQGVYLVHQIVDPTSSKAVMQGNGQGKFEPLAPYSRQEAYLTILRVYNYSTH
ncbi:MAG: InlB B-repeat-containing protein [Oscillospiraceae bacterium]|nr:InlB B-repeat-containing protein [Oscillospiraceae bacterium]